MDNLELEIRKLVLQNAVKYEGKPSVKSVMSALLGSRADLRSRAGEVKEITERLVREIEKESLEAQRSELMELAPELVKDEEEEPEQEEPPELPNADKWDDIVMRLAPFPSGTLHVGNARMVILNDYYVKRYGGKLILVFDDTIGSEEKKVEPEAYDLIPEGLEYLGVDWDETVYKSDRLEIFYEYAVDLIKKEEAYVCDCDPELWRNEHKVLSRPCPCRELSVHENLARWEKMLDGTYPEKGAAVRIKTGMDDPDPAMRDHVILRISEAEHPRVGNRYRVWPMLEYSWGIDDHELGISHIIRGKDLVKEGKIEQHIWRIYGWAEPELIYYGRLKFKDATLSKSRARRKILSGEYTGWKDPRTWSLQSLEHRGIHPDALRKATLDLGLSLNDITFSMKAVYSENRKIRDSDAPRAFFVESPVWISVTDLPNEMNVAEAPIHPDYPDRGTREIPLPRENEHLDIGIPTHDFKRIANGELFRLKDLANCRMNKGTNPSARFESFDVEEILDKEGQIIHWVPKGNSIPVELTMVDGSIVEGVGEPSIAELDVGTFLQFERVGFAKIYDTNNVVKLAFAHK